MNLPYAISDFGDLRREGFFYADKTRFIPLLEDKRHGRRYVLFLRPRRFGKSTLLSMLEHCQAPAVDVVERLAHALGVQPAWLAYGEGEGLGIKKDSSRSERTSILPRQCVAARALLDMTQQRLAELSGLTVKTVMRFESGAHRTTAPVILALRVALEDAGILFVAENGTGPGVALRQRTGA